MRKMTLASLAVLAMCVAPRRSESQPVAPPQSDSAAAWDEPAQVVPMPLWDGFPRRQAPGTGRAAVQLTSGDVFCYPLYYFIPSFTADAKYLIHYRAKPPAGGVQLVRLNLRTGESVQMSHGTAPRNHWRPWCTEKGGGVLDHRSVLNVARNEVIYFDGNDVRLVDVETLEDKLLFTLPDDREAIGQNTVTPNGEWLVYIDAPAGVTGNRSAPGVKLVGYHFDTGEERVLTTIDHSIHHVTAYDNQLWAAEGEGEWIQYDLGEVQPVGRIFIAWHAGDQRRQRLQIAVSTDGERWEVVFDGLSSGTASGAEPVDVRPFRARYVRIVGNGNTANRWNSMRQAILLPQENGR